MIEIKNIIRKLNEALNSETFSQNRHNYEFRIRLDTDEFTPPSRVANEITQYVHGIAYEQASDIETVGESVFNGSIDFRLDLLIPIKKQGKRGQIEILTTVRGLLDNYFSRNQNGVMLDDDGNLFSYGLKTTLLNTGTRETIPAVGDCITFSVYLNYVFIQDGVNSKSIHVEIDGSPLGFIRAGEHRQAIQESNVQADDINAVGKNVTTSTQYTLSIEVPATLTNAYRIIRNFIRNGDRSAHLITIKDYSDTNVVENNYVMTFNEAGLNYETYFNAAINVKLVEANTNVDSQPMSAAAQAYLEAIANEA